MYFAGKVVYIIALASVQFAIIQRYIIFTACEEVPDICLVSVLFAGFFLHIFIKLADRSEGRKHMSKEDFTQIIKLIFMLSH